MYLYIYVYIFINSGVRRKIREPVEISQKRKKVNEAFLFIEFTRRARERTWVKTSFSLDGANPFGFVIFFS